MTRPLTCADRPPEIGDVLQYGHDPDKKSPLFWQVTEKDETGFTLGLHDSGLVLFLVNARQVAAYYIAEYRYHARADKGRVDWPVDSGAFV